MRAGKGGRGGWGDCLMDSVDWNGEGECMPRVGDGKRVDRGERGWI